LSWQFDRSEFSCGGRSGKYDLPAQALGTAVNSMAGQNIGRGKWKRVSSIATYGVLLNMAVMVFIILLIYAFALTC
jgi:Na+-driven multidrug efflux pump